MKIYNKINKITDLGLLDNSIDDAKVLLAYQRKNYAIPVKQINQKKIIYADQTLSLKDGDISTINLIYKNGAIQKLLVRNGSTGDKGAQGEKGPRGIKGTSPIVNTDISKNYLMIVNDTETDDKSKVLSALQGIMINEGIENLSETFLTDSNYQLLFRNLIFLDAEFECEEGETILIYKDTVSHKVYVKYWTFEEEGVTEYYVLNDFAQTYDAVQLDLWNDIYLGAVSGYFEATTNQLTDGTELFVYDQVNKSYKSITVDELGNRSFIYTLPNTKLNINTFYDKISKIYDYNLIATELQLNLYKQVSAGVYERIVNKNDIDLSGFTLYYQKIGESYELIPNVSAYIEKKSLRYFKHIDDSTITEVESLDVINTGNFENYIMVEYDKVSNTNIFTSYKYVKDIYGEESYEVKSDILNNYSINYYIYDDNREYFTRRLTEMTNDKGETIWDYEYTKIRVPFWIELEYEIETEDTIAKLMHTDVDIDHTIKPIYINGISFTEPTTIIGKGFVNNIDINYYPNNINVTDVEVEYDDTCITLYEDGRIAAIESDEVTFNTQLTVYSAHDNNIKDTINITVVTPVKELKANVEQINLYPGESFDIDYTTVPEQVTDNSISWVSSDTDMISITSDGVVTPKLQSDGTYKTGNCKITLMANDGFGAKLEIPILVALPISKVEITSKNYGFIGVKDQLVAVVTPSNATEQTLKYSSSDPEIIKINETTGEYTPLKGGSCTLSATTTDGTNITASIDMTITVGVSEIKFDGIDDSLDVGLTNNFTITVLPEDATNKDITLVVNEPTLVDISTPTLMNGSTNVYECSLTVKAGGNLNVAVIANDGSNTGAGHDMILTIPVDNIEIVATNLSIFINEIAQIQAIIGPENASNKEIRWISSNPIVATIDQYGRAQGLSVGKTTISAISTDSNSVVTSCVLTVNKACETLSLNGDVEIMNIELHNTSFINAIVTPDDATNQIIQWISSDETIVSVNENGVITGNKLGNAIITGTTTDGSNISKSISVDVVETLPITE